MKCMYERKRKKGNIKSSDVAVFTEALGKYVHQMDKDFKEQLIKQEQKLN